jgi:hypothetical protein
VDGLVQGQTKFVAQINDVKSVKSDTFCFNHDDSSSNSEGTVTL